MARTARFPLSEYLADKGDVAFAAFVEGARQAGLRPDQWLMEKRAGKLTTELLSDGSLVIRAVSAAE